MSYSCNLLQASYQLKKLNIIRVVIDSCFYNYIPGFYYLITKKKKKHPKTKTKNKTKQNKAKKQKKQNKKKKTKNKKKPVLFVGLIPGMRVTGGLKLFRFREYGPMCLNFCFLIRIKFQLFWTIDFIKNPKTKANKLFF